MNRTALQACLVSAASLLTTGGAAPGAERNFQFTLDVLHWLTGKL